MRIEEEEEEGAVSAMAGDYGGARSGAAKVHPAERREGLKI
jgi:hypothetical protein